MVKSFSLTNFLFHLNKKATSTSNSSSTLCYYKGIAFNHIPTMTNMMQVLDSFPKGMTKIQSTGIGKHVFYIRDVNNTSKPAFPKSLILLPIYHQIFSLSCLQRRGHQLICLLSFCLLMLMHPASNNITNINTSISEENHTANHLDPSMLTSWLRNHLRNVESVYLITLLISSLQKPKPSNHYVH